MSYKNVLKKDDTSADRIDERVVFDSISDAVDFYTASTQNPFHTKRSGAVLDSDVPEQVHSIVASTIDYWKQFGFMDMHINIAKVVGAVCNHADTSLRVDDVEEDEAGHDETEACEK